MFCYVMYVCMYKPIMCRRDGAGDFESRIPEENRIHMGWISQMKSNWSPWGLTTRCEGLSSSYLVELGGWPLLSLHIALINDTCWISMDSQHGSGFPPYFVICLWHHGIPKSWRVHKSQDFGSDSDHSLFVVPGVCWLNPAWNGQCPQSNSSLSGEERYFVVHSTE